MSAKPSRRPQSHGRCAFCAKSFAKGGMRRHLESCAARAAVRAGLPPPASPGLYFTVDGGRDYWLHLETAPTVTVGGLDSYLRQVWLECCGHLSCLVVAGREYGSGGPGRSSGGMSQPLNRVFRPGTSAEYAYDFGSTTYLTLRCWDWVTPLSGAGPIVLLARNEPPEIPCGVCRERPAAQVCTGCSYDPEGWLCAECAAEHACGEELLLPVVNSPRTGVCGYTGD